MTHRLSLEDNFDDILGKAQRGLKLSDAQLAAKAGVSEETLAGMRAGRADEATLRSLAKALELGADALIVSFRRGWQPRDPREIAGLVCFSTSYGEMLVNSYVVFDPATKSAAAFDTGADCSGMLALPVKIEQIFLTHAHGDHIGELDRLKKTTGATAFASEREPVAGAETFMDGHEFRIGHLRVETQRTSGHARGGTSYVVTGLMRRLVIVGDAMFAGSMGGGLVNYSEALRTNRENILSLPEDTVICPGHGPLTTVGEEKRHNPFFAV